MSPYDVYALRYARSTAPKAQRFHRYTEPDGQDPMGTDFYFWLVRDYHHTVLVDCGFDGSQTSFPGYRHDTDPVELLARLDVTPEQVDHVVLTHMHFDHIGNIGLFPNATFSIARAEYEFWTGPHSREPHIGVGGLPHEIAAVTRLVEEERVQFVDKAVAILPGIEARVVGGHTPGQIITEVTAATGQVVLASDASHYYEAMEHDRPFWLFVDLEGMFRTYEMLRELAARPDTTVVPGHDPAVMDRYVLVADECADLSRPR